MKLNKFSKFLCLAIAIVFVMASTALAVNVTDFVDFPDDWSTPAMEYAVENDLIKGYEDNTIRADRNITRAEMGTIVNRAFGSFIEATKFPYLDVEDVAWFYSDMKKAVNMGTMQGSNNLLRPDDPITREEAFIVIARAYSQKNTDVSALEQYGDSEDISNWAKEYLSFLTENDYVNGFDDGNLYPQSSLTRAELSQIFYNMIREYVGSQSELDEKAEYNGNIIINGKIANITGKTFNGDLVIGDGVGVEEIVIKNTNISGCLIVRGTKQIKIVNSTVGNRIIVNNPNNNVHFDNYKNEKVFNNVEVQTSATWKAGFSGGGGTTYYSVRFYNNYGGVHHAETVASGSKLQVPANPIRLGYTFGGWYTTSDCTTAYDFMTPVRKNLELYAKWTANKYTISFEANNGVLYPDKVVTFDGKYGDLPVPVKPGYTFDGWYLNTKEITKDTVVKIVGDSTLTAKWTANEYTITFDEKGGNVVPDKTVTFGKEIGALPVTSKTGYTFNGWTIDGIPVSETTVYNIADNKTAVAEFTANTYKLTFEGLTDEIIVIYDDKYPSLPTPTIPHGQNFVGWFDGSIQIKEGNIVEILKDTELKPVFTNKAVYTVTFDANGGTPNSTQSVIDGDKAEKPTDPTKTGHKFTDWYKDAACTQLFDFSTPITGDITVYAGWSIETYTVIFKDWNGTVLDTQTVNYGQTAVYGGKTPARAKDDIFTYAFDGWDKSLENITVNTTVTAQYIRTPIDYTVKFVAEGKTVEIFTKHYNDVIYVVDFPVVPKKTGHNGVWSITTDITVNSSIVVNAIYTPATYVLTFENLDGVTREATYGGTYPQLPTPTIPHGQNFVGWFDGSTQIKEGNIVEITKDTELKPVFTNKAVYTVTFDANGGTSNSTQSVIDGDKAEKPTDPTREGHSFGGWYKDAAGTQPFDFNTEIKGNLTIYAKWAVNQYTYTFYDEDETTIIKELKVDYGTTIVAPADPTKAADAQYTYTFKEWEGYTDGMTVVGDVTFKAVYERTVNQYTYTFYDEDETTIIKELKVDYGTTIVAPADPTKAADAQYTYTFKEWEGYTDGMTVVGDVTFKAVYEKTEREYTITFKNWDDSVLETKPVKYGETIIYTGATPARPADAQYTYTFSGWDSTLGTVTGDAEFTAQFEKTARQYTVTFVNYDGTQLGTSTVNYGTSATYTGETPARVQDVQYTYTFSGWNVDITNVTGDMTATAQFTTTLREYTITFKNWNDAVLETKPVKYGETIIYTGATPEKPADAQYTYTFSGWDNTLGTVTGDAEFTAQFEKTIRQYTVTFVNYDGTQLGTSTVNYGTSATYTGETPARVQDVQYTYTFSGWDVDITNVTGDMTATAQFTTTLREYIITFKNWDDAVLETKSVKYGETIIYTGATPEKPADAQYTYTFSGWDSTLGTVSGDAEFTAQFTSTINKYKVTWLNEDGNVLETDDAVEYGTVPTYDGATPEKASTTEFKYTFKEWTPAVVAVTGEAVYKATYTEELNSYEITFKNYDGSVLETKSVKYGETIIYTGATPEKPADAQYTYTFSGWDSTLGTVSGDAEFTAQFEKTTRQYTVTFVNYDGTQLGTSTVNYGTSATYTGETPARVQDVQYTYTFSGWDVDITNVTGDMTATAQFTTTLREYTITFKNWNDAVLETKLVKYDETIIYTGATPEKPADAQYTYTFSGWDSTLGTVSGDAEFTAQFEKTVNQYTYIFYDDDGTTELKKATVDYGTTIVAPADPVKSAEPGYTYTFKKWEGYTVGMTVSGNVTFKAVYDKIANNYVVKYDGKGAIGNTPDSYFTYDVEDYLENNGFVKVGNTFLGWSKDENATVATYADGELVKNLTTSGEITLYAVWQPNTYYVTYDANSGAGTMSDSEHKYGINSNLAKNVFEKIGYTFTGWATSSTATNAEYADEATVSTIAGPADGARITLYAVWEANKYTIVFNGNNNTSGSTAAMTDVRYDETVTLTKNGFEKAGYKFMGWDTDATGDNVVYEDEKTGLSNLTAEPDGVINLYAVWAPITYTVKFVDDFDETYLNGDTLGADYTQTFTYDEEQELMLSRHKHKGYHVIGWTDEVGGVQAKYLNPEYVNTENAEDVAKTKVKNLTTEDGKVLVFYTVWQNNNYFVAYDGDDTKIDTKESVPMVNSEHEYDVKSNLSKNTYKKVGYDTFVGWNLVPEQSTFSTRSRLLMAEPTVTATYKDEHEILNLTEILGDTVEMIAVWKPNVYYVQYNKNDDNAEGTMNNSEYYYDTTDELAANKFTLKGFSFDGWKSEDGTIKYADSETISNLTATNNGIVKLYATWTENGYTVKFNGNGATLGEMSDMTFKYTDVKALSANKFERKGYTFKGWATSSTATTAEYTDKESVSKLTAENNGVVTLYAVWEANTYKLTFDVNGGKELTLTPELSALGYYLDGGRVTIKVTYDGRYPTLPTPEFVDETMFFVGWELNGNSMPADNIVKIEADTTLKAIWTDELVHNVVFNKYYEDGTAYTTTVINKTAIAEPQDPTKTGYEFNFWSLDEENGSAYDFTTIIQSTTVQTINLYPHFTPITYYVSYNGNGETDGNMSNSTHTYDVESKLSANAFIKDGYTFMGWDTDPAGETVVYENGETVKNLADEKNEVVTLYAVWAENAYTVIYDGNGATDGSMTPSTHYIDTPKALTANAFVNTGYEFLGWSEDKNSTTATYTDGQVVVNLTNEEKITLYAIWKAETYKLTFDVNGGNALELTSELEALGYYLDGGKITVDVTYNGEYPQFPKAEYPDGKMSFGGWSIDSNIIAAGDTVNITEDKTLVAVWTNKHIVVFHGYYNDGVDSLTTYVEDGATAVKPEDPDHSQFAFSGWYTDEACTDGNEYDFATIINKVNDEYQTIHLYPKWMITVTFYYGPEALDSEKKAELLVPYNTVVDEADVPADRVAYGYWKDITVSKVYVGEEYKHNIEFKWHEAQGDDFVVFDLTQPIVKNTQLFNVAKVVDINVSSSFNAINGANINAVYTDDEPLYENILDVIFENQNLVNSVYDKIEQKEKVFDKLESLGIIDENRNILNQAKFLKFSLIGEERLEKFVYENVEKELTVDAKESITSYINHLIEKNDGSAEKFLKELIDALLKGEGKEEMKGVLADMLTEMVDIEKDEFIKYVNKYIDDSIAAGNTQKVEELIHPQIEKLLTEAIAKDFVREMTKEQLTNFVKIYADTLTETELKAEVKDYIEGLDETEIEAEVVEYVNGLTEPEIKDEITTYINSLTDDQLKEEITSFVDGMNDDELSDAIVEYINTLTVDELKAEIKGYIKGLTIPEQKEKVRDYFNELEPDEIKAEIKKYISDLSEGELKAEIKDYISDLDEPGKKAEIEKYIDGLDSAERTQEVTSYVQDMDEAQFKTEIKEYILGLGNDEFKVELKKYLEENEEEYEKLIREHLGLADDEVITDQDKIDHLEDVIDYVITEPGKKDEVTEKAAEYIKTSKRADYEAEIISKVTSNFASYKADIVDKAMNGDLNSYIDKAVAKIVDGENLNDYIDDVVEDITADANTTANYVNKTVEYIAADAVRLDTYIDKAIGIIVTDDVKKNNYIEDTAYSIATGANRDSYAQKAVNTIVNDASLKAEYTQKAIDEIVSGSDKEDYVIKAVKNILAGADRDSYIDKTIDKIFADNEEQTYIDKAVAKIVDKTPLDYSEIDEYIEKMFTTPEKKAKVVNYINEQFIANSDFRVSILPDAIDMIFADSDSKNEVVSTIVDFVINDEEALADVTEIAIEDLIEDADFRENTIDKIADYLEHHPDIMEEVMEFAKESELGVFVDEFVYELMNHNQFKVHPDNLFVAESIERALAHYDYDSFMNQYIPGRFAGLIPDSILKPIYDNALGGFTSQLKSAIESAKNGGTAYVDCGVTVKFNPVADILVPVFDKYLELREKGEDKLDSNNGTVGNIYDNAYGDNKYVKALVDLIAIESLLDGDKSLATEKLSGYSLKEFGDYYEIVRNATTLLTDAGKWYVDTLPQDKAEAAQEKLAQKVTEYFNSILALVNTYAETEELPSYKDVLEIFEGDIPDRFFDKYESALGKVEVKVDIDDKLDTVYNKLAEKGIVSKFNTVLDKFIASKFNRELAEEQIPLVYTFVRRALGYDDFYTVDTVFNVMNEHLTRFKVDDDTFAIGNNKLKITIERTYK